MRVIEHGPDRVLVELTSSDVSLVVNSLNEVLHGPDAVEEWEFSTRIGGSQEVAKQLLRAFSDLAE